MLKQITFLRYCFHIMQDTKDKKQTGKKAYQTRGNSRLVTDSGHFREIEDFADQTIISGSEEQKGVEWNARDRRKADH